MKTALAARDPEAVVYHEGYAKAAARLRPIRYGVLVLLILSLILSYFLFRNDLSLEKFRFFLRNLEITSHAGAVMGDEVSYNGREGQPVAFIQGALVNLEGESVTVTDRTSSPLFSGFHGYRSPGLVTAGSYFLIYDRVGDRYSLYNPFARLTEQSTDSRITHAALSENGRIALATDAYDGYYSIVTVTDESGAVLCRLSKYKYVTGLALDENGKELLVCGVYVGDNGELQGEIQKITPGKTQADLTLTYRRPVWQAAFFRSGRFALSFDDGLRFYDEDGEIAFVPWDQRPVRLCFGTHGVASVSEDPSDGRLTLRIWDDKGRETATVALPGRVQDLVLTRKEAVILTDAGLYRLAEGKEPEAVTCPAQTYALGLCGEDVYAITPDRAVRLDTLPVRTPDAVQTSFSAPLPKAAFPWNAWTKPGDSRRLFRWQDAF